MKRNLFILFFVFFSSTIAFSATITSTAGGGSWNTPATWQGGVVPAAGDSVIVLSTATVLVDVNTNIVKSVNVYGIVNFVTGNGSDLKMSTGLTIQSGAVVNNTGSIELTAAGGYFNILGTGTYYHNPYNNVLPDESIFYNSLESFSNTCSLYIQKWFDISIPLGHPSRVQISNFGNLWLSVNTTGLRWNQKGYFSPNRIKGALTITDGIILMDDGQGATVQLILQQVFITTNGSMIVRSGTSAPYTFTTGSFSDNSASTFPTVLADTTFTLFTWNASGNVLLSHYFIGMVGTATETGGDLRINVTGNLTIGGTQTCHFVTQCDAPLRLLVTGATTISGTPTKVRFLDGNSQLMNFTTNDFIISGGTDNVLMGGGTYPVPKATGIPTITINNDFVINGSSSTYILNSDTSTQKLRVTIGRDFIMGNTGAQLIAANHLGANTFATTRHFTINGGQFLGEKDTLNTAIDSVIIGGNFSFASTLAANYCTFNGAKGNTVIQTAGNFSITGSGTAAGQGVFGIYDGNGTLNFTIGGNYVQNTAASQFNAICITKPWIQNGSLTFNVSGMFDQDIGIFRGINNKLISNSSIITFTANSIDFDGGNFSGYHAVNNVNAITTFNITNNCKVNFAAATDTFTFVGVAFTGSDNCFIKNNVTIGGSFILAGAAGHFLSSYGNKGENYTITGGMTISGGINYFNPVFPLANSSHNVTITMGGTLSVTGGTTILCQYDDSLVLTVNSNFDMTGGSLTMKGRNGMGIINIKDGFSMTGGSLFLRDNATLLSSEGTTITVNSDGDNLGDFSHLGGTITFDTYNQSNPAALPTIIIKSPTYTIGGTGSMTRNTLAAPQAFGALRFARNGTINFNRSGNGHNIQQVQQFIESGTTVDVNSGDFQIASGPNLMTLDLLTIYSNARLALRTNKIKSNQMLPNSGFNVIGTLATQHPNGMYNGTANAAVDASGGMNYYLQPSSTVEYYGTTNQVITGINVGLATNGFLHKYYDLDINMSPGVWAYPTSTPTINSTYVRHNLNLLAGELSLDSDHVPTNGGSHIIIEDSTINAITQVAGFIRSETQDGSGQVRWNIGRATGSHVFPFGYTSAVADRIPFTYGGVAGKDADTVSISTYHTSNQNLPYPPTVTHINNNSGVNNWANTVDRFWYIALTGSSNSANLTFSVLNSASSVDETFNNGATITTLRAQRWIPAVISWELNYQGSQSNPQANSALVTGATLFPNWWTLSGNNSPLPVELLSFSGSCEGKNARLKWVTATEINNDHFNVERSLDGVNYEVLGKVQGHGNSSTTNSYLYSDEYSLSDMAYYRLQQVDFDGSTQEFGPVIVKNCQTQSVLDLVVTGQEAGNTNLLIESPYPGKFNLVVVNIQGQIIINSEVNLEEGFNLVPLESDLLSTGIYHVRLQGESDSVIKKIFINRN